jgi:hypothetical protein
VRRGHSTPLSSANTFHQIRVGPPPGFHFFHGDAYRALDAGRDLVGVQMGAKGLFVIQLHISTSIQVMKDHDKTTPSLC